MRVHVLSDLHVEFANFDLPDVDADITVLAGDVHTRNRGLTVAERFTEKTPVVYVAGNHEFYGTAIPKLYGQVREQSANSSVHFLQNETIVLGDARFIGTTLWTDYCLFGPNTRAQGMAVGKATMTDFRKIRVSPDYRKLTPSYLQSSFQESIRYLKSVLSTPHAGPTVVVTHHAPSVRSIDPQYQHDLVSASYASNLEQLILANDIDLWIHGHTHHCVDYKIGNTRIVSNQRGYPGESTGFDPTFCVTL